MVLRPGYWKHARCPIKTISHVPCAALLYCSLQSKCFKNGRDSLPELELILICSACCRLTTARICVSKYVVKYLLSVSGTTNHLPTGSAAVSHVDPDRHTSLKPNLKDSRIADPIYIYKLAP